ncbi:hypothetical protein TWF696_002781 [Orbilia brochopaga]|uniref:Uncharacterized protein n=1 Tax=Orbilia brochopaga TaxID=3140254 RepID=A0AAV9U2P1_9PEZI
MESSSDPVWDMGGRLAEDGDEQVGERFQRPMMLSAVRDPASASWDVSPARPDAPPRRLREFESYAEPPPFPGDLGTGPTLEKLVKLVKLVERVEVAVGVDVEVEVEDEVELRPMLAGVVAVEQPPKRPPAAAAGLKANVGLQKEGFFSRSHHRHQFHHHHCHHHHHHHHHHLHLHLPSIASSSLLEHPVRPSSALSIRSLPPLPLFPWLSRRPTSQVRSV